MFLLKNKKLYMIVGVTFVMLIFCAIFWKMLIGYNQQVELSVASGFYDEPFYLEMSGDGGTIYYTLDGSEPDRSSNRYTGPILIEDASLHDNVYSMRTDISPTYDHELLNKYDAASSEDYVVPDELVDKCTVVRAVCIDAFGGRSKEACGSYFIGFGDKSGYDNVRIVSLYTDPDNLFDYKRGIYVTGKVMDDYLAKLEAGESEGTENDPSNGGYFWWWWPANYRMSGRDWERKARVEIFNENRSLLTAKDIGIRIQGGGTRGYVPKSLNLYARKEYDGTSHFDRGIFESDYEPESLTLFAGGDSKITKVEDYLPSKLAKDMNFSTMELVPCVMFLDGEYWGYYYLAERYDANYFAYHYGVKAEDVLYIKNGEVAEGDEKLIKEYAADMDYLKSAIVTNEAHWEELRSRFDIDSYLDYYAMQLYIDRKNDWPATNIGMWKTVKTDDSNPYYDGRWRFVLFDDNSGCYEVKAAENESIKNTRMVDPGFNNLMDNPEFDSELRSRLKALSEGRFAPDNIASFINEYEEFVTPVMYREFDRFWGERRDYHSKLHGRLQNFIVFFENRYNYIQEHVDDM